MLGREQMRRRLVTPTVASEFKRLNSYQIPLTCKNMLRINPPQKIQQKKLGGCPYRPKDIDYIIYHSLQLVLFAYICKATKLNYNNSSEIVSMPQIKVHTPHSIINAPRKMPRQEYRREDFVTPDRKTQPRNLSPGKPERKNHLAIQCSISKVRLFF